MDAPESRIDRSALGWGIALVLAGFALTLVQLDLIQIEGVGRFWPLLVIGGGILQLSTASRPKKRRGGAFVALVGIWLLVNTLGLFGLFWHDSWPVLMILIALLRIAWPRGEEDRGGGFVLLAVGTWLLLTVTGSFGLDWHTSWPILLVFVGIAFVVKALVRALPDLVGGRS
jgi:hypothetical protein